MFDVKIRQALAKEIDTISTTLTLVVFVLLFYKGVIKFYIYNPFNYDICLVQLHFSSELLSSFLSTKNIQSNFLLV